MAAAKFKQNDKVNHPAGTDDAGKTFSAGVGTIAAVIPGTDGTKYRVKCDATGSVIPFAFPEADLSAV